MVVFVDGEVQVFVYGYWVDQGDFYFDVVIWYYYFDVFWQFGGVGDVGGVEVELWMVVVEEWGVVVVFVF